MTFAVTATVVAVSTVGSLYSAEKSRKQQKKTMKAQEKSGRLQSARDAMSQVRQARIAQAQIVQGASTQGTQSSSAAQGGFSAVGSLTSGNMQFLNQMDSMNSQISRSMQKSQMYAGQSSMFGAIANTAMAVGGGMSGASSGGTGGANPTSSGSGLGGTAI